MIVRLPVSLHAHHAHQLDDARDTVGAAQGEGRHLAQRHERRAIHLARAPACRGVRWLDPLDGVSFELGQFVNRLRRRGLDRRLEGAEQVDRHRLGRIQRHATQRAVDFELRRLVARWVGFGRLDLRAPLLRAGAR